MKNAICADGRKIRAYAAFAVAVMMAVTMMCAVPVSQAHAKGLTLENAKGTAHIYPSDYSYNMYWLQSSNPDTYVMPTKVKVSNKKVCTAEKGEGAIFLYFNKQGKTTLSYKWKGKSHKVTIVFHAWKNPVKSFKVGGKQYAGKFKKQDSVHIGKKTISGKVSIKAAKGWKFKSIEIYRWGKDGLQSAKMKNNKTLAKSKKMECIYVTFVNKKTGQEIPIMLNGKDFYLPQ